MLTSVFKKSTLPNTILILVLLLAFFFIYQSTNIISASSRFGLVRSCGIILILLLSLFLVNFTVKKNNLTKDSSYTILFFFLFLLIFPAIFKNTNLVIANFFILLAIRRLISLQTLKTPKEKIFDASIWIFIASLFYFWALLFIFLIYISIYYHVSRDYRNWLLPFVAFFATSVIFLVSALIFDKIWITQFLNQIQTNFQQEFFFPNFQNFSLLLFGIIALYFLLSLIFSLTNKPLILQASFKKIIFCFLIGVVIFLISPNKDSEILLFTFMPLSLMCTTNIEYSPSKWYQELVLLLLVLVSFFSFFFGYNLLP